MAVGGLDVLVTLGQQPRFCLRHWDAEAAVVVLVTITVRVAVDCQLRSTHLLVQLFAIRLALEVGVPCLHSNNAAHVLIAHQLEVAGCLLHAEVLHQVLRRANRAQLVDLS